MLVKFKHEILSGCDIFLSRIEKLYHKNGEDSGRRLRHFFCPQHMIETCQCGIEWGHHSEVYEDLKKEK